MKYGIFVDGMLMRKFDSPEDAYDAAKYAYEEKEIFHAVVEVPNSADAFNY